MISQTAKIVWGAALVSTIAVSAYWVHTSDPVRDADLMLLRDNAAEVSRVRTENAKLQEGLPTEDVEALRTANSDLLVLRNQTIQLRREADDVEKTLAGLKLEETPELKQLAEQRQRLRAAVERQNAVAAQAQAQFNAAAVPPVATVTTALINRLRGPDGSLSPEAGQAAVAAIRRYREENNNAEPPSVDELIKYIPEDLLREDSDEVFEVLSVGPEGTTVTPGENIRARRR